MSFWTAVVVIVAIGALVKIFSARNNRALDITHDENGQPASPPPGDDTEARREIEALQKRIKVLERIATEDRETKNLSNDIDKLRDD